MQPKKNYDSEFCGSLPLNFTNQIQSYGVLLVLNKENMEIVQVSRNITDILGREPESVYEKSIGTLIPQKQFADLQEKIQNVRTERMPLTLSFEVDGKQQDFLALMHIKDSFLIMELEAINYGTENASSFVNVYQEIKHSMAAIEAAPDLPQVWQRAVSALKKLSGFDRVLVYRFDEEWNGTVVAEAMEEDMESYMGLRFPASDIPKQARGMYQKNPYRQIPDREYTPVKLYPVLNPMTNAFTDLSDCNLRSVAGVHLEYMANMGIKASMSTRILKGEKLWGIISCHHRKPKFLNYEQCSVFELMSGIISARLSSLENKDSFSFRSRLNDIQSKLVEQLYSNNSLRASLLGKESNLLHLLNANGAAIIMKAGIETIGTTPDREQLKDLIAWLQSQNINKTLHTDSICELYDSACEYAGNASGMIVLPINPDRGEFIICFRQEYVHQVNWGGNPNEAISFEDDKKAYHPRNSFKLWQQTVKNTSMPWREEEVAIAESFRNVIIEYTYRNITV